MTTATVNYSAIKDRKERVKVMLADLQDGVSHLVTTDDWKRYLDTAAKFHHYSFGNTLLILSQCPAATRVMGYGSKDHTTGWLSVGRHVKGRDPETGEKQHAIWILAPVKRRVEDPDTGEVYYRVVTFRPVPVYDISQTEGEPLPEPAHLLKGEAPEGMADRLANAALGFGIQSVTHTDLARANGVTYADGRVEIRADRDPVQQVKTLAHEVAHWLLGHLTDRADIDRDLAELEAESVAYVVMAARGIDSSDYSFGYVAHWADGDADKARDAIGGSANRIQAVADKVLEALAEARRRDKVLAA